MTRAALACTLLAALTVPAEAAAPVEAVYLMRLSLPVAEDDIAHGHCVSADVHTGEVFVCDPRANRILVFDAEGYFDAQIVGGADLAAPEDLAVDPDGLLVLLARRGGQRRVPVELDFDGQFRREVRLVGLPADAVEPDLVSVALSPAGDRLYLADQANSQLWIADRDGLLLTGVELESADEPDSSSDFAVGHVDTYGDRVVVAMPALGRILVFSLAGEPVGFVGDFGSSGCKLGRPTAAAIDRNGDVLVLDSQRMVVARWRIAGNRCLSEHIGLGSGAGYLYFPYDLSLDPRGRFYVAQSADGRVQVYEGLGEAPAPPPR